MHRRTLLLLVFLCAALLVAPAAPSASAAPARQPALGACAPVSAIAANFNGTPLAPGNVIWFNSHFKLGGLGGREANVFVRNATVRFSAGGVDYVLPVEPAQITYSPSSSYSYAVYDDIELYWVTWVSRANLGANVWIAGAPFVVPAGGLPGGIGPVTWTAEFATDTPGLSVQWQWSAAVYTAFGAALNDIGVKAVDGPKENTFEDADKAGTPWFWKEYVTGGARGGGGSNYTGGWSGTGKVALCVQP